MTTQYGGWDWFQKAGLDSSGNPVTDSSGANAVNVVGEVRSRQGAPTNYAGSVVALDGTGVGGACASGATELVITITTVPTAGNLVLIGFGEGSLAAAQANVDASTPTGQVVGFTMDRANAADTSIYLKGSQAVIPIPQGFTAPYYAIAETGTPAGSVIVNQRG